MPGTSRSILIVEDEPLIAMMLEDFLESLGHDVVASCEIGRRRARPCRGRRLRRRDHRRPAEGRRAGLAGRRPPRRGRHARSSSPPAAMSSRRPRATPPRRCSPSPIRSTRSSPRSTAPAAAEPAGRGQLAEAPTDDVDPHPASALPLRGAARRALFRPDRDAVSGRPGRPRLAAAGGRRAARARRGLGRAARAASTSRPRGGAATAC